MLTQQVRHIYGDRLTCYGQIPDTAIDESRMAFGIWFGTESTIRVAAGEHKLGRLLQINHVQFSLKSIEYGWIPMIVRMDSNQHLRSKSA